MPASIKTEMCWANCIIPLGRGKAKGKRSRRRFIENPLKLKIASSLILPCCLISIGNFSLICADLISTHRLNSQPRFTSPEIV